MCYVNNFHKLISVVEIDKCTILLFVQFYLICDMMVSNLQLQEKYNRSTLRWLRKLLLHGDKKNTNVSINFQSEKTSVSTWIFKIPHCPDRFREGYRTWAW